MISASAAPCFPHLCACLLREEPVIDRCGVSAARDVRQGGVRQPQQVAPVAQAPPIQSIQRLQSPVAMHAAHREVAVLGQVDLLLQGRATSPRHGTGPGGLATKLGHERMQLMTRLHSAGCLLSYACQKGKGQGGSGRGWWSSRTEDALNAAGSKYRTL